MQEQLTNTGTPPPDDGLAVPAGGMDGFAVTAALPIVARASRSGAQPIAAAAVAENEEAGGQSSVDETPVRALLGYMNPSEFRDLLREAELKQRQLARLAHVSPGAVSRWCSGTAKDRLPPPPHIVALVAAYALLSQRERATLHARLAEIHGHMVCVLWSFVERGWAQRSWDGGVMGWTRDVAKAGRWRRREIPSAFGSVVVSDPYWPTEKGVAPLYPEPPADLPQTVKAPRRRRKKGDGPYPGFVVKLPARPVRA